MQKMLRFSAIALVLVCLACVWFAMAAQATQVGQATLTIRQRFASEASSAESFTYRLTARTAEAPLPAGSDAQGYGFTITGAGETQVGPIQFSAPGIYVYELRCITEDHSGYTIDRQIYTIEMHVVENLAVSSIVYISNQRKVPEILFEHSVAGVSTPPSTTPSTPSNTTTNRPDITTSRPGTTGDGPKTGDFSNPTLWTTLIVVSSALLAFIMFIAWNARRRRRS